MANVYYTFTKTKTKETFDRSHICFSQLAYQAQSLHLTPQDTVTYNLKNYKNRTDKQIRQYLYVIRQVPEFKKLLPNPEKIIKTNSITYTLGTPQLQVFLGFTLLRAIDEEGILFDLIRKSRPLLKLYNAIDIIKLLSYITENYNHWISGMVIDIPMLYSDFNYTGFNTKSVLEKGRLGGIFNFMNVDVGWTNANHGKIYHDFLKLHKDVYAKP